MSKKLLFYIALFIILVLIIVYLLFFSNKKSEQDKGRSLPTPINSERIGKMNKEKMIVRQFQLLEIGPKLSESVTTNENSYRTENGIVKKLSTGKLYEAYIIRNKLIIRNTRNGIENSVNLSENLLDSNFVFLNNKYLMLIEKENSFHKLDKFYIVNLETFEKLYFAGSFPIISRLDLSTEPIVNSEGSEIYFQDRSGIFWLLKLTF